MPWPKGMPRKGHINKDGTTHAAHGQKIVRVREVKPDVVPARASQRLRAERVVIAIATPEKMKPIHGESTRPIIEPCPNCNFAYADGGYCPECGWSLPIPRRK